MRRGGGSPSPSGRAGRRLAQALVAQMAVDPDEIFKLHQKTCPLNEVFSDRGELPSQSCALCCPLKPTHGIVPDGVSRTGQMTWPLAPILTEKAEASCHTGMPSLRKLLSM